MADKPVVYFTHARAVAEQASHTELAAMVREQARIIDQNGNALLLLDDEVLWEAAERLERYARQMAELRQRLERLGSGELFTVQPDHYLDRAQPWARELIARMEYAREATDG